MSSAYNAFQVIPLGKRSQGLTWIYIYSMDRKREAFKDAATYRGRREEEIITKESEKEWGRERRALDSSWVKKRKWAITLSSEY